MSWLITPSLVMFIFTVEFSFISDGTLTSHNGLLETLDLSHNHIMAIDDNSLSGTSLKIIGQLSRGNNKSVLDGFFIGSQHSVLKGCIRELAGEGRGSRMVMMCIIVE